MSGNKNKIKYKFSVTSLILFIILAIYAISLLTPFTWSLFTSFKDRSDYIENPLGLPEIWRFENYITAFNHFYVPVTKGGIEYGYFIDTMFINSFLYSGGCAILASITPCVMAYLVAKFPFKMSKIIYSIVVVAIALPIVGSMPSEIMIAKSLGLFDTLIGAWIMKSHFLGVYFLVYYATFKGISNTYAEAAQMDGAGNFTIFFRIILPLVKNTIFTVILLYFIQFWNDYQTPMVFLPSLPVVAYGMYYYSQNTGNELSSIPMQMTGCMLMLIPILLVFTVFHKRILGSNITMGGIKE